MRPPRGANKDQVTGSRCTADDRVPQNVIVMENGLRNIIIKAAAFQTATFCKGEKQKHPHTHYNTFVRNNHTRSVISDATRMTITTCLLYCQHPLFLWHPSKIKQISTECFIWTPRRGFMWCISEISKNYWEMWCFYLPGPFYYSVLQDRLLVMNKHFYCDITSCMETKTRACSHIDFVCFCEFNERFQGKNMVP